MRIDFLQTSWFIGRWVESRRLSSTMHATRPGKHTKSELENGHRKWIYPLKMVIFHSYVNIYQRVISNRTNHLCDPSSPTGGLGLSPLHSLAINASINPHTLHLRRKTRPGVTMCDLTPDLIEETGCLIRKNEDFNIFHQ